MSGLLLAAFLAAPARAEGCFGLLARGAPEAAACFAPGTGPGLVPAGDYRWRRLSTGTWLAEGPALVVVDLSPGPEAFAAARVYHAARPWPEPSPSSAPMTAVQAAGVFNETFGAGRVEEWVSRWDADAEFVSVVGPFEGGEVGRFFRKQAERYLPPRMTVTRDHGAAEDGSLVMEGVLSGRCRRSGTPFEFPFLMVLRWKGGRLSYVWEAFAGRDDGCGPFWTAPR